MHEPPSSANSPPGMAGVPPPDTVAQRHEVIMLLWQQVTMLREQVAAQQQELAELRAHNALLEERLKLSSRNSSKPPSSDGPGSGNRAQRRASERKRGVQMGHPGSFRAMVPEERVSEVVPCAPPAQCGCGAAVAAHGQVRPHQVFELPPIQARVSEYRLQGGRCTGCGRLHWAVLPDGVPSGQLGPRALALIGVLGTRYQLSQHRIRDLLAQLLGIDFSIGTISQAQGKVAAALKAPVQQAAAALYGATIWMRGSHLD